MLFSLEIADSEDETDSSFNMKMKDTTNTISSDASLNGKLLVFPFTNHISFRNYLYFPRQS